MTDERIWPDEAVATAVASADSWRAVLRHLGENPSSSSLSRHAQRAAERLGLDTSHFRGGSRWTEQGVLQAVASGDWSEVAARLGVSPGSIERVRAEAARLGLPTVHLEREEPTGTGSPRIEHLNRAAPLMAAAWFTLCGGQVSWPLEPCRYDLLVELHSNIQRVQVKTGTRRDGRSWIVWLSSSSPRRRAYAAEEIDSFFIIDGDLSTYLIPQDVVAGRQAVCLSAYQRFRLPDLPSSVGSVRPPSP